MDQIIALLSNGGWGIAAMAIYGMTRLYLDGKAKDALVFGLLNQHNEILKEIRSAKTEHPRLGGGP